MKLLLTEKYSVARDLAVEFSRISKKPYRETEEGFFVDVYFEGEGLCKLAITYAMGHLFEIDDEIVPGKWSLDSLPLFPEKFRYRFRSRDAAKRFSFIEKLLKKADELYLVLDPGREGESIGRLILKKANWTKWNRTYRIWTSKALTADVVLEEMKKKLPASEFDSLFYSALARQHADFVVGINFTRAVTLTFSRNSREEFSGRFRNNVRNSARSFVWSVGRVQTPTLRLIVERDLTVENFKRLKYFVIKAEFEHESGFTYTGILRKRDLKSQDRKEEKNDNCPGFSKEEAEGIIKYLEKETSGTVWYVEKVEKQENSPELFSLTTLQRQATSLFKVSAEKVHQTVQKLYQDYKAISYPRTEATGLPENMVDFVKNLLQLFGYPQLVKKAGSFYRHVFDEKKLTDHHAIIPLVTDPDLPPGSLEEKVFNLIKRRFIASFMDPYRYISINVKTQLGRYYFVSNFKKVVDPGWKILYEEEIEEKVDEDAFFCEGEFLLKKHDTVVKKKIYGEEKETKPPLRYTDGSLITEMKKLGLGTPATRDAIIETLIVRNYVKREKGFLVSTEKGRKLIENIREREISSPEMTAKWEEALEKIYSEKKGKEGYKRFMNEIRNYVEREIIYFLQMLQK